MSSRDSRRAVQRQKRPGGRVDGRTEPPLEIGSFMDALNAAWGVVDRFHRGAGGFVVAEGGHVMRAWVLTAPQHTLDDVVSLLLVERPAPGSGALLVTADDATTGMEVHGADVQRWDSLRTRLEAGGYEPWDWIHAGAEGFRSMHFATASPGPWPGA